MPPEGQGQLMRTPGLAIAEGDEGRVDGLPAVALIGQAKTQLGKHHQIIETVF